MIINKEAIVHLAAAGKRLDARKLDEYRQPLNVETNISWTAEGSARVQIGDTVIMAGVKLEIEKPYNDTPNDGGIMVNVELLPLSSPEYEPGPPSIKAVELARVIDRGIREAQAIDMKKLCIIPGEKAWFVIIDLITINDAGNLFDAAGLASLAALKSARFPVVDKETGAIDYKQKTDTTLPLRKEPLPVTIYKINGNLFVDPTRQEEETAQARLTVATDSRGLISAMQKGGSEPLTINEIKSMVEIALEKAAYLRELLNRSVG